MRAIIWLKRSMKRARFGRPVSSSWDTACNSRCSASFRAEISNCKASVPRRNVALDTPNAMTFSWAANAFALRLVRNDFLLGRDRLRLIRDNFLLGRDRLGLVRNDFLLSC